MPDTKTALVTGAAGFTGRYMVTALQNLGYRVVALVESVGSSPDAVVCDLTDRDATVEAVQHINPSVVVHLAAVSFVGHGNPEEFYRVNVLGTENLLAALATLERLPKKVLLPSSANVYGTPSVERIDESLCPAPVNHYGMSKLAMEHMAKTWFEKLPIIITRPFNYTGPGQDARFVIPKIVEHFAKRASVIELGNIDVSRDFSDVNDVVMVYCRLLESDVRSQIVNVCSGRAVSLRDVLAAMRDIAGYAIEVHINPALVRENELRYLAGDQSRLEKLVEFRPFRPLSETLNRMYAAALADSKE